MKTIYNGSGATVTLYWKIMRGENKVTEDLSNLKSRVFLIGSCNTYSTEPDVVTDEEFGNKVLKVEVDASMLSIGVYDVKAMWEKNDGRNIMKSARTGVFAITDNIEEVDEIKSEEVIRIASYVESIGRDGLSAYEIAVIRGLNNGLSENDWVGNEAERIKAEQERASAETTRNANETERKNEEDRRQSRFNTFMTDSSDAFSDAQTNRDTIFTQAQGDREVAFTDMIADFETRFNEAEDNRNDGEGRRNQSYAEAENKRDADYATAEANRDEKYDQAEATRNSTIDSKLSDIEIRFKDAEDARKTLFNNNEDIRQTNEQYRIQAEGKREKDFQDNEQRREQTFQDNEVTRQSNEIKREEQESIRQQAEQIRIDTFDENERGRIATFNANEAARIAAENERKQNEDEREANEVIRQESYKDKLPVSAVVQETGDGENLVMSQKAVSEIGKELSGKINEIGGYEKSFSQESEETSILNIYVNENFKVGEIIHYTISNVGNPEVKYFTIDLLYFDGTNKTYDYNINSPAKKLTITDNVKIIRIESYKDYGSTKANSTYTFNVNVHGYAENMLNKITELSANVTDEQYPSAACVYRTFSNLLGSSISIINDDASKNTVAVNFDPIKAGTKIKIVLKDYEAEKAPYFTVVLYYTDSSTSTILVESVKGKYKDIVRTLNKDARRVVVKSLTDYGATIYNAKFNFEIQIEGVKEKVDNISLYTPNDSFTAGGSGFKSKLTALDVITKPKNYNYALKYESYKKIEVKSQAEFENLTSLITEASNNYNNIDVNIAEGAYMIKGVMLDASQITNNACRIAISGSNVKILGNNTAYSSNEALFCTGTHNVFRYATKPTIGSTIFTDGDNYIPISESGFNVASGAEKFVTKISSASSDGKTWKAQLPNRYSDMFGKTSGFENMRLWYACQWTGRLCEISGVDDNGYIHFIDEDKSPSSSADSNPSRFVLINNEPTAEGVYFDNEYIYIPIKYSTVYQHEESSALSGIKDVSALTMCGLNFVGVKYIVSSEIHNTLISNCTFNASVSFSKSVGNSPLKDNCELSNCILNDFYNPRVFAYGNNIIIENNVFERLFRLQRGMPLGVLLCGNGLIYCGKNKFIDMASEAIWSGLYYNGRSKHTDYNTFRSVIEYNEIYQTKDFKHDRYSCYDAGSIYLATNACNPIVRYNYIHDIKGYVTHGIYCDDGAYGCSIYKNIICNIMDGYSINSRIVNKAQLESFNRDTDGYPSNVDNLCMYNIINAPYLFRGSTEYSEYVNGANRENNGCCCAKNLRMEMLLGISKYETLVDNINEFEDDINSKGSKSADGVIKIGANISSWEMPSHFNGLIRYYTI